MLPRVKRLLLPLTLCACVTTKGDLDTLKPTLQAFHNGMRWKELRKLSSALLPERRDAFDKASKARDDEKNLFVTDYQLEECKVDLPEGVTATCYSKISWYRLPSSSEKTVSVATTLRWKGNVWLIDKQSDGPFAEELSLGDGK
jgi:hypothetical protein